MNRYRIQLKGNVVKKTSNYKGYFINLMGKRDRPIYLKLDKNNLLLYHKIAADNTK